MNKLTLSIIFGCLIGYSQTYIIGTVPLTSPVGNSCTSQVLEIYIGNLYTCQGGIVTILSGSGGGVSSFSGDGNIITNAASTGAVTTTLHTVLAHKYLGNNTGSTAAPAYDSIVAADLPAISLTSGVSGILPIANGGTATATPGLVAGTNITITGSWPNQTITSSGGGSGCSASGSAGVVQASNGSGACQATSITDNSTTVITTEPLSALSVTTTGSSAGIISFTNNSTPGSVVANSWGWTVPTTITTAWYGEAPNASPGANQFMLFPSPTSNVSQWAWTTFTSTNLTDTANLVYNNTANAFTSSGTANLSASTVADAFRTPVKAGFTAGATGSIGYDSTNSNLHAFTAGADAILGAFASAPTTGHSVSATVTSSKVLLSDAGYAASLVLLGSPTNHGVALGSGSQTTNYTGAGTTGQVLTSNGASADPTYQTATGGGGTSGWSGLPLTFVSTTTQYAAPVGGALTSGTETVVSLAAPASATYSSLAVSISAQLGSAATLTVTLEDGTATPSSLTCTTSSGGTSCTDITHSVNVTKGDLLSFKIVSGGTVTAGLPQIEITYTVGVPTSGGSVNSGTANQTAYYVAAGSAVSGGGPGTAGQVWTSNGVGSAPTFQPGGSLPGQSGNTGMILGTNGTSAAWVFSNGCDITTYWCFYDDFLPTKNNIGIMDWDFTGSSLTQASGQSGMEWSVTQPANSSTSSLNLHGAGSLVQILSTKTFDFRWRSAINSTTVSNIWWSQGWGDSVDFPFSGHTNNFIGITYDTFSLDTQWMCLTSSGGTITKTPIVTADTSPHWFRVWSTTPGTINCSVDSTAVTGQTTNVPTVGLSLVNFIRSFTTTFQVEYDVIAGRVAR